MLGSCADVSNVLPETVGGKGDIPHFAEVASDCRRRSAAKCGMSPFPRPSPGTVGKSMSDVVESTGPRREGSLEAPTRHALAWRSPEFTDAAALDAELARVFDICHGCRRCFSLCNSFPTLFDAVDATPSGELHDVPKEAYWQVVDHCYLCDMCYMTKCPYVPPHEWNVDFPHLMLRAKFKRFEDGKASAARQDPELDRHRRLARGDSRRRAKPSTRSTTRSSAAACSRRRSASTARRRCRSTTRSRRAGACATASAATRRRARPATRAAASSCSRPATATATIRASSRISSRCSSTTASASR